MQPLSRGRAAEYDRLGKAEVTEDSDERCTKYLTLQMCKGARKGKPHAFGKPPEKFFQKNFRKNLEVKTKRLTFANAFPLKKRELERKDSSLKDFG